MQEMQLASSAIPDLQSGGLVWFGFGVGVAVVAVAVSSVAVAALACFLASLLACLLPCFLASLLPCFLPCFLSCFLPSFFPCCGGVCCGCGCCCCGGGGGCCCWGFFPQVPMVPDELYLVAASCVLALQFLAWAKLLWAPAVCPKGHEWRALEGANLKWPGRGRKGAGVFVRGLHCGQSRTWRSWCPSGG